MLALRLFVDATPFFWCLLAAGAVALAAQAWLLRAGFRRRARRRALRQLADAGDWATVAAAPVPRARAEVLALATLLLVPVATFASVQHARGLVGRSLVAADPAARAQLVTRGWKGQLGAIPVGIALEELAGALGVIAWSFAFAARRQIAGLVRGARMAGQDRAAAKAWARAPGPATEAVVGCAGSICAMGLLPVLQGAYSYCMILGRGLTALEAEGVVAAERLARLDPLMLDARWALDAGTAAGRVGLMLAVLTSAGLLWWRSPARARRQNLGRTSEAIAAPRAARDRVAWGAIACLAAAAALYLVSLPLRAENRAPWPPSERGDERAAFGPVLEVAPAAARLDGVPVEAPELWRSLERSRVSRDALQVVCGADTPASRLVPFLEALRVTGFERPAMTLGWRETVRRPLLGTFRRERATNGRVRLVTRAAPADGATATLTPGASATCGELAARVAAVRREGRAVALLVP